MEFTARRLQDLQEYGFKPAGSIYLDGEEVKHQIDDPEFKLSKGQVYAWVIDDTVVYIGMASKGINKRLNEHRGGWRGGSATGISKAKQIRETIHSGQKIKVYGRVCDSIKQSYMLLGEQVTREINLVDQEEDVLLKQFKPVWNTNGK